MEYRVQKNITLSSEEIEKIIECRKQKTPITKISQILKVPFNKVHNNMRLLGLVQERKKRRNVDGNIFFNVDDFGRYYRW